MTNGMSSLLMHFDKYLNYNYMRHKTMLRERQGEHEPGAANIMHELMTFM